MTATLNIENDIALITMEDGKANAISRCGGTWATKNSTPTAISMLRPWSAKRLPWSKPTEYITSRPMPASRDTANARGKSNP